MSGDKNNKELNMKNLLLSTLHFITYIFLSMLLANIFLFLNEKMDNDAVIVILLIPWWWKIIDILDKIWKK